MESQRRKGPFSGTMASSATWVSRGGTEERLPPRAAAGSAPTWGKPVLHLGLFPQLPLRLEVSQVLRALPTFLPSLESRASQQDAHSSPPPWGASPPLAPQSPPSARLGPGGQSSTPAPEADAPRLEEAGGGWTVWGKCPRLSEENSGCL